MIDVKAFVVAFWRAMGNRDNFLAAARRVLIAISVLYGFVGLVWLTQVIER